MAQSAFARRFMEKQGWKEGDGLGKNKDGISEPIKVNIKQDKTGVGHDPGSEFTDHWWLRVFNEAANTITKSEIDEDPNVSENPEPVSKPKPVSKLYKGFVKVATLDKGAEKKDPNYSSDDDDEMNQNSPSLPTLDDLHKFCGGATGHRAATLGIKMKGKLSRAAEHERLFNERLNNNNSAVPLRDNSSPETENRTKRKKHKKKKHEQADCSIELSTETFSPPSPSQSVKEDKHKKKSKRKHSNPKKNDGEESSQEDEIIRNENIKSEEIEKPIKSKSKKRKKHKVEKGESNMEDHSIVEAEESSAKKRKSKHSDYDICETATEEASNSSPSKSKHKKKKKKKDKE